MSHFIPLQKINNFTSDDFVITNDDKIEIKDKLLSAVLFIDDSETSELMSNIWKYLSKNVIGVKFHIYNLLTDNNIIGNQKNIKNLRAPFIIVYKDGIQQEIYQGVLSEHHLLDFSIKLVNKFG